MNILIVNDINMVRIKLEKMLTAEGFDVFTAAAIRPVVQNQFSREIGLQNIDLALIDINLQGEDGFKLLSYLTENYPQIKSITMSAEARENLVKRAVKLGAANFLTKPFDKKTLLEKVNATISAEKKPAETKKTIENQERGNDLNAFKTAVSLEVSRTIRSKDSFSLVKISYSQKIERTKINKFKSQLTAKIRDIDRLFYTGEFEYIFLLPLTDIEGRETFSERIISEITSEIEDGKNMIQKESLTFPDDIIAKNDLQYNQHDYYVKSLFAIIEYST